MLFRSRVVAKAQRLEKITFEEMLEMASLGSKVLQIRAVEFAGKYNVPLRVLHSFKEGPGTLITIDEEETMEQPIISGSPLDGHCQVAWLRHHRCGAGGGLEG